MKISFLRNAPIALLPLICIYAWSAHRYRQDSKLTKPVSYKVLHDAMGVKMTIGVESNVTEQQLMATLSRAADDHQYDAARDLLLSSYFSVEAYLVEGDKRSAEQAGTLKRYVPQKKEGKKHDFIDWLPDLFGKEDKFSITLKEAKVTLR